MWHVQAEKTICQVAHKCASHTSFSFWSVRVILSTSLIPGSFDTCSKARALDSAGVISLFLTFASSTSGDGTDSSHGGIWDGATVAMPRRRTTASCNNSCTLTQNGTARRGLPFWNTAKRRGEKMLLYVGWSGYCRSLQAYRILKRHRRIANGGSCASGKILDVGEVRKAPVTVLNAALWIVSTVQCSFTWLASTVVDYAGIVQLGS